MEGQTAEAYACDRAQTAKVLRKIPLSSFAAWLDCSAMYERKLGPPVGRPWSFGFRARRSFTVSGLQTDASPTAAVDDRFVRFRSRDRATVVTDMESRFVAAPNRATFLLLAQDCVGKGCVFSLRLVPLGYALLCAAMQA